MIKETTQIKVDVRALTNARGDQNETGIARMYVSGTRDVARDTPAQDDDVAWKEYNEAKIALQRDAGYEALETIKADAGLRLVFSRKLGCGCGCSPGFLVRGGQGLEIFVTVKPEAKYADATDDELSYHERYFTAYVAKGRGYTLFERTGEFGATETTDPNGELRELGSFDYGSKKLAEVEAEIERRSVKATV